MVISSVAARPAPVLRRQKEAEPEGDLRRELTQTAMLGAGAWTLGAAYPSTWLHEMGHALTAEALFEGANPIVSVTPFGGGVTRWTPGELTPLGEDLGYRTARAAVSAAGPLVDIAMSMATFGIGFAVRKKYPMVGKALMGYAGFTMLNDIFYAGSALGKDLPALARSGNDFASLGVNAGIHPLVSMGIMAAVLPLEYLALKGIEKLFSGSEPEPGR